MTFSERLAIRKATWWPPMKWHRRLRPSGIHQIADMHRLRRRDAPDRQWHCCPVWQRSLSHKWNSREFAAKHDCRVPELYWHGWRPAALPIDLLPSHFVVRPSLGAATHGTFVIAGDRELLRGSTLTRVALRDQLIAAKGRMRRAPLLVEEFVRSEDGHYGLPLEYKFYSFGRDVAAIHVLDRRQSDVVYGFYTADWTPFADVISTRRLPGPRHEPPRCFPEMLAAAQRLGAAYGTFVRSDFYATDRGCVFGEFAPTPHAGQFFTDFAQQYFGDWWHRTMPDRT